MDTINVTVKFNRINEDFMRYTLDNLFNINTILYEIEEQKRKWEVWLMQRLLILLEECYGKL